VVTIDGRDVTKLPPRDRDVAMVFQSYALYPHLTVKDNLAFGLRLRKTPEAEIATRIGKASAMLGLDPLLARYPKQLSGGQRQRVAMGRAIVRRAKLFLYDEPLSNLDAALRADVRVQIRQLHDQLGATSLYVTHDQVEAMTLADTLWILNGGRVEQSGAPLDVFARPASTFVAKFLGSPPMNLIEGASVQGTTVRAAGMALDVNPARYAGATGAVTVGVRPHELVLDKTASEEGAHVRAEVRFVERLGPESFVHAVVGDAKFIARLGAEQAEARALTTGEIVTFTARADHVHLFDAKTGRALDLP
jgi:sn-glycerol 3-phosphate transport system ATP-binding protein/multiple sugar transport system ATP-binding protein